MPEQGQGLEINALVKSRLAPYRDLSRLLTRQLAATPQYKKSLTKRLVGCETSQLAVLDQLARQICCIAGEQLEDVLHDYDWICRLMLDEEMNFRRSGRYRITTFEEAVKQVYSNDEFMQHYMNGLLISQLWWSNHTETFNYYQKEYLAGFVEEFRHLEIGPGHGLFLFAAGQHERCMHLEAWDVSHTSIAHTRAALGALGLERPVSLEVQNMFEAEHRAGRFDSVVMSELLEHLERPSEALMVAHSLLSKQGRLFINMPVNSPAPDHIFLLDTPEEVLDLVSENGFDVKQAHFVPQTGLSLERARKYKSTISVALIATPKKI